MACSVTLRPSLKTMKRGAILVIEDRDDVRQGLAQLLELHGFLVADASNGEEALQQLTSDPEGYALILLDLMLPGAISGRDVRLRQLPDPLLAAVPTIVVSASDIDHRERVGLRPGRVARQALPVRRPAGTGQALRRVRGQRPAGVAGLTACSLLHAEVEAARRQAEALLFERDRAQQRHADRDDERQRDRHQSGIPERKPRLRVLQDVDLNRR